MRLTMLAVAGFLFGAATSTVVTQGPIFDVVSIKRNASGDFNSTLRDRPDGGFSAMNQPVALLIARAHGAVVPADIIGLPGWVTSERYDVNATAQLVNPTPADRLAMLRAMLADRFKLAAHIEKREVPVFDLVLARKDGKLGVGIRPSEIDCVAKAAADRAAVEAARAAGTAPPLPRFTPGGPVPACTIFINGPKMEGDFTMATLAGMLRVSAGRPVVDKTGVIGSYRVTLEFDRLAGIRGPDVAPAPDGPPSVFTAVQEQLGLKLEPSRAERDVLVVDRVERPTEN